MINKPGRRLMHAISLAFVQKKVSGAGRRSVNASLNLTSMIDFLLIIVVFLLMTFSASGEIPVSKTITLPAAENTLDMVASPIVAINGAQILVNEHPVDFTRAVEDAGRVMRLEELYKYLQGAKKDWEKINPIKDAKFPGIVILQVDREVPALVVKSVFQTAASAGYPNVSFMVGQLPKRPLLGSSLLRLRSALCAPRPLPPAPPPLLMAAAAALAAEDGARGAGRPPHVRKQPDAPDADARPARLRPRAAPPARAARPEHLRQPRLLDLEPDGGRCARDRLLEATTV
ncbi:MAG: biopolymer transporter ExbD [Polyangiaceae bacterium]|jgi:biopolymer transport protein ExbD|nr:biopolymer transporter ExbD [Polyangiaceae bacterium]